MAYEVLDHTWIMFGIRRRQQKRDSALGLDIGSTRLKAVVVRRGTTGLELAEYATQALPETGHQANGASPVVAALDQLLGQLKTSDRRAYVTVSCGSAMVCQTKFPRMPLEEIRSALKFNSAKYLLRDFSNFYLDAVALPSAGSDDKNGAKINILVGGASKDDVSGYRNALAAAKVRPEALELAAVSVINAFGFTQSDLASETVLLLDIGARSTTINFLRNGQPLITRIMPFGGDQISEYIAQVMLIDVARAESDKLAMAEPVQELVRTAISPLAREIRSSIDFFERQHDCHVSRMFACGGSACSPKLLDMLGEAAGLKVECWNPVASLNISHFNGATPTLTALGPSLAAAVGAAVVRL